MGHTVTIELPEDIYYAVTRLASEQGKTPEQVATEWIVRAASPEADELLRLAGCIDSDVPDAGDRHDEYIGEAILRHRD